VRFKDTPETPIPFALPRLPETPLTKSANLVKNGACPSGRILRQSQVGRISRPGLGAAEATLNSDKAGPFDIGVLGQPEVMLSFTNTTGQTQKHAVTQQASVASAMRAALSNALGFSDSVWALPQPQYFP
jgi:hypothetical protein